MFGFEDCEQNHVTKEQKDGGYDGIFFLPSWVGGTSAADRLYKVIFEAKLRTAAKNDLSLNEFSKSLIIAVNIAANMIIIATNLHFSKNTVDALQTYSLKTGLGIKLITAKELMNWLRNGGENTNGDLLDGTQIKQLIQNAENAAVRQKTKLRGMLETLETDNRLVGEERGRQLRQALAAARNGTGLLLISGEAGVGKSVFSQNLMRGLEQTTGISTGIIDLQQCQTPRILFIRVLEQLWQVPADILLRMDRWDEVIQWIGEEELGENLKQAVLYAFRQADREYEAQASLFNECLVEYLYRVQQVRRKKSAFCFSNVNYASKDLLVFFRQICTRFQSETLLIVELREFPEVPGLDSDGMDPMWEFSNGIRRLQNIRCECQLEPFDRGDARTYVRMLLHRVSHLEDEILEQLIDDAGSNPLVLSAYINFIESVTDLSCTTIPELLRIQERLTYREDIIKQFILSICEKDSSFTGLLAVLGMLNGTAAEDSLSQILERDCARQIEYLIQSHVCEFKGAYLCVRHSVYLHSLRQYYYIGQTYLRKLAARLMAELDQLVPDFQQASMVKIDLYRIRGEIQQAIIQSLEFIQELYNSGQYYLTYDYGISALKLIDLERTGVKVTLQKIRALMYVIQASFYIKGDSVSQLQSRIDQARALMNLNQLWLRECDSYYGLNCRLYLIENQYYHQSGNFTQAYETMKDALDFLFKHREHITDEELAGEIWLEYGIAVKEHCSLEQAILVLKKGITDCPTSKILQFTLNTQLYEQTCPSSVENGRVYLEKNAELSPWLKPAEVYHNRVHLLNCLLFAGDYDSAWNEGEELLLQTSTRGLRNEEGRVCNILACLAIIRGKSDKARTFFDQGSRIFDKNNYISNFWPLLLNYGTLLTHEKDWSGAEAYLSRTYDILSEHYVQRIHTISFHEQSGLPRLLGGLLILRHNIRAFPKSALTETLINMDLRLAELCGEYVPTAKIESVLCSSNYNFGKWFLMGY